MYFDKVFKKNVKTRIPPKLLFTIENLVSQILVEATADFLKESTLSGNFVEALCTKLKNYDQVPSSYIELAEDYLRRQQDTLVFVAFKLITYPADKTYRANLIKPSSYPK